MWGLVEVEPEVENWLRGLSDDDSGRVQFYIDLLEREGVALGEPYSRQLRGKLRELRFYLGRERRRVTYYIARGRRQILLTVFAKQQGREANEIDRAERAMLRCIAQGHETED